MRPSWPVYQLSEVCTKISDGTHHSPKVQHAEPGPGRFKYVTSKNVRNSGLDLADVTYVDAAVHEEIYGRCNPERGDVLLTKDGVNTGNVAVNTIDEEFSLLSSVALLKPDRSRLDARFLKYYIESPAGSQRMIGKMTGTAIRRVILRQIKEASIPLPALLEQRRIVAEIEKQVARLDAACGDLDAAKSKLVRFRAANLETAFDGDKAHNWGWKALSDVATVIGGLTKNPARVKLTNRLPYLRVANVYRNELRLDHIEYIGVHESELDKLLLRRDDLLIVEGNGSRDQIGRMAIWDGSIEPCVHQNHLIKVRLGDSSLAEWISYWFQSERGRSHIETAASSTSGLYTLSVGKVSRLPIPLAPSAERDHIVAELERRFSVIDSLKRSIETNLMRAKALRQSILHKAFSDQL